MDREDRVHYKSIKGVLIKVLLLNWLVALAKIIYGLLTRCASMLADGLHSLADGTSNIIGLVGIRFASQPIDFDHPYGHKKYETFFSLGIAALLLLVAFNLIREGIARFISPVHPEVNFKSFLIMLLTMVINFFVMRYESHKGAHLKSDILVSDSLHTKADIFTSISVIIALIFTKLGYPIVDPIATIIIALFIAYAAYQIIRDASRVLCDTAVIVNTKQIVDLVLRVKGVKTCHKIRTRGRSDDIHIDLHVQVSPGMHIDEAHKISYVIEDLLKKEIPCVSDVVVHMEPIEKILKSA
jgi:cation diffusion facilitator family transporter